MIDGREAAQRGRVQEHRFEGTLEKQETAMGLFDGVLGGIVGGTMASVVNDILERHGGVQGVVSQFEQNGLGPTVRSWVGTDPNAPISPTDLHRALGPDLLQQLAAKAGMSVPELTQKLAQVLPQAIDHLTPAGSIPKA
ncbi:MAG TPA: YidB family protein [Gemmatimonadaceae bacterium]|nr:YidB family protein [Gemmatimonadaceae bacterium]